MRLGPRQDDPNTHDAIPVHESLLEVEAAVDAVRSLVKSWAHCETEERTDLILEMLSAIQFSVYHMDTHGIPKKPEDGAQET